MNTLNNIVYKFVISNANIVFMFLDKSVYEFYTITLKAH